MVDLPVRPPLDLDAHAEQITREADRTVEMVLKGRAEMDRTGLKNEPFILTAGEKHNRPGYHLYRLGVEDRLQKAGETVSLGYETIKTLQLGLLMDAITETSGASPRAMFQAVMHMTDKSDEAQKLGLKLFMARMPVDYTNHAEFAEMAFLLKRGIRTTFNDAIWDEETRYLARGKGSTRDSIRACFGKYASRVKFLTPKGQYARSHHMASEAWEDAKQYPARIKIQQCGSNHSVAIDEGCLPEHTLPYIFKKMGAHGILAVTDYDPENHGLQSHEVQAINIPSARACRNEGNIENAMNSYLGTDPLLKRLAIMTLARSGNLLTFDEEADYFNGVAERMGLKDAILTREDLTDLRREYSTDIQQYIAELF